MDEIWKDVPGYEGIYQVSNIGRVKRLPRVRTSKIRHSSTTKLRESIRRYEITKFGYARITLIKNGKPKKYHVHRLVALAFILNPENKNEVNHRDGNKINNVVQNLEWNTGKENQLHLKRVLKKCSGTNHYKAKLGREQVQLIKQWYNDGVKPIEISRRLNIKFHIVYGVTTNKNYCTVKTDEVS